MDPTRANGNEAGRGVVWKPRIGSYISSLKHFDASSDLEIDGLKGSGGFADVYKARLHRGVQGGSPDSIRYRGKTVAVKRFRTFIDSDKDFQAVRVCLVDRVRRVSPS